MRDFTSTRFTSVNFYSQVRGLGSRALVVLLIRLSEWFCLFLLFHSTRTQRSLSGDLALARALGDFKFKKNKSLGPQAEIFTADPAPFYNNIGSAYMSRLQ
jgi:hypothetical protein